MPNNTGGGTTRRNRTLRQRANNSNTNSINRNRSRITSTTTNRSEHKVKWVIFSVALTLLLIYGFLLTGYVLESGLEGSGRGMLDSLFKENNFSTSDLLLEINAFNKRIIHTQKEVDMFLHEDPFVEVFKQYIQPVLDKVSSIRSSIQIYEKMDRTQGGPIHFIETSIQDLENLEQNELTTIELVGAEALEDKILLCKRLLKDVHEYLDGKATLDLDTIDRLKELKISVHPDIDPDDIDTIDFSLITFENLVSLLDKLAWRMAEGEHLSTKANDKLHEMYAKYNVSSISEAVGLINETDMYQLHSVKNDLEDSYEEVVQEIQQNQEYYKLIMPYRQNMLKTISDNSRTLVEYETTQRNHYRKLVRDLEDDIQKLKERLNNLRHKTPKRVEL